MKLKKLKLLAAYTHVAGLLSLTGMALPGDLEHLCNAFGVEVTERWANPSNVPWQIVVRFDQPLPGFPTYPGSIIADSTSSNPTISAQAYGFPGVRSMVKASQAWSKQTMIGNLQVAGNFSMSSLPTLMDIAAGTQSWALNYGPPTGLGGPDGMNTVNLWEDSTILGNNGITAASGILARADVLINASTALILECDITLPADLFWNPVGLGYSNSVYAFAELSADYPVHPWFPGNLATHATVVNPSAAPGTPHTLSPGSVHGGEFLDLLGVLVHEFGHLAGLGHSLVDGKASAATGISNIPTMFPYATRSPVNAPVNYTGVSGTISTILGRSAGTLQADDMAAILKGYPNSSVSQNGGSIQGIVRTETMVPLPGVHIVAFKQGDLDNSQVSTFSYSDGRYTLAGLTPGEYLIYAEPVDQVQAGGTASEYYWNGGVVPNFVFLGPTGCIPTAPSSATTNWSNFVPEFWNSGDAGNEGHPAQATTVSVVAGTRRYADFVVNRGTPLLTLNVVGPSIGCSGVIHASPRGALARFVPGQSQVRIQMPALINGDQVTSWELRRSESRLGTLLTSPGIVPQVSMLASYTIVNSSSTPPSAPIALCSPLLGSDNMNTFYQAKFIVTTSGGASYVVYSMPVNVLNIY